MNKSNAFIISFLITILLASNYFLINSIKSRETAVVSRVIDGDTIVLEDNRTIRLLNVNSPEKSDINSNLSKEFLINYENKSIQIEIIGLDKYNRYLARIYSSDYINLKLVSLGYSSKFLVETSELKEFSSAEKQAIEKGKGIWAKSEYYGCFQSKIDEENELVLLTNNCPDVNTSGFYLKDESRKTYKFRTNSFNRITLHTKEGEDTESDIFWNSKTNIWNNYRDSIYVFGSKGRIIHYNSYGY